MGFGLSSQGSERSRDVPLNGDGLFARAWIDDRDWVDPALAAYLALVVFFHAFLSPVCTAQVFAVGMIVPYIAVVRIVYWLINVVRQFLCRHEEIRILLRTQDGRRAISRADKLARGRPPFVGIDGDADGRSHARWLRYLRRERTLVSLQRYLIVLGWGITS